jgi:hypothetical protein
MDDLIYDRLSSDVETALNSPGSSTDLKGSYNYTDLNRVEEWCEYLKSILVNYGFSDEMVIKTNWKMTDFPTRSQIDRIRSNIDLLKNFCYSLNTETIIYNNTMNYEQANVLEKILYDINQYFEELNIKLDLAYNYAATLIRRNYIDLPMNMDVIKEENKIPTNYNVGILPVHRKYITLVEEE